jgi:hypothetical protein
VLDRSREAANVLRRETAAGNPHAVQSRAVEERSLLACAPSSGSKCPVSPLAALPDPPAVPLLTPWAGPADRVAALEDERTRLLSRAVGDHLPHELALRVAAIERELAVLGRAVG